MDVLQEDFLADFAFSNKIPEKFNLKLPDNEEIISNEEEQESKILEPNHPLLAKFQQVLKEYLVKQIANLDEEVLELEISAKKRATEREKIGIETYEAQQMVTRQTHELDNCISSLQSAIADCDELTEELENAKEEYTEAKQQLFESERKEIELRKETEAVSSMLQQLSKYENNVESDLLINQRIAEKTRKEKIVLAKEKRSLDMYVYKLTREVWRLEGELETQLMQLRVKEEERNNLAESVAASNADLEAQQAEYKQLLRGWQEVIVCVGLSSKHHNEVTNEQKKLDERLRSIRGEIEQVKKLSTREMERSETLGIFRARVENDMRNTQKMLDVELEKKAAMESKLANHQAILDQIERDFNRVRQENAILESELRQILKTFEASNNRKAALDDEIMSALQGQITNDKASRHMHKTLREARERNFETEIALSNMDNINVNVLREIEIQKVENGMISIQLQEELLVLQEKERDLANCDAQMENCARLMRKATHSIDFYNRKLDKLALTSPEEKLSPMHNRINELEKQIEIVKEKNKELQAHWLREQQIIVDLSMDRQGQLKDMDLLKKQIMVLQQKNLKITDDLVAFKKEEMIVQKSIMYLRNKLSSFYIALNKKKDDKDTLDMNNHYMEKDFIEKLQDSEMESLLLESECGDLEEEKMSLSKELMEKNREALAWERKIQLAIESRKSLASDMAESGEMGKMKAEIHRMQVRLSQLRKAQDKLTHDLEHCVTRRESILVGYEAATKLSLGPGSGPKSTRHVMEKKFNDLKNKQKRLLNSIEEVKKRIERKDAEIEHVTKEITESQSKLSDFQTESNELSEEHEKLITEKQFKLDFLLIKQRKLKIYAELSRGRLPFTLYKTPATITNAFEKEKELNTKLQIVIENLITNFPQHYHKLIRISNTLKLPMLFV